MSVNCPYNPAHIMPPDSFLRHLSRCTATNKKQFSQCKYNQLHVYRKEAIQQHEKKCPDRKANQSLWVTKQEQLWKQESQSRVEDWDEEDKPKVAAQKQSNRGNRPNKDKQSQKYQKKWQSESDEQQQPKIQKGKNTNLNKKQQEQKIDANGLLNCDLSMIAPQPKGKGKVQDF